MKNILLGIGGTGARMMKAFMFLAASDNWGMRSETIIPLLIDNDAHNPAVLSSNKLIQEYNDIKKTFKMQSYNVTNDNETKSSIDLDESESSRFFLHRIEELKIVKSSESLNHSTIPVILGASDDSTENESDVLEYFFSDNERTKTIDRGFYGMPNIGSVAYDKAFYDRLKEVIGDDINDSGVRIFIVGSLFGGTGAAGIPSILDRFRNDDKSSTLRNAEIHILPVIPYFSLLSKSGVEEDIKASLWKTKSRYAIEHYKLKMKDYFPGKSSGGIWVIQPREGDLPRFKYGEEGTIQDNPPSRFELDLAYLVCNKINSAQWPLEDENVMPKDHYKLKSMVLLNHVLNDYNSFIDIENAYSYDLINGIYKERTGGTYTENHLKNFIKMFSQYLNLLRGNEKDDGKTNRRYKYYNEGAADIFKILDGKLLMLGENKLSVKKMNGQFKYISGYKGKPPTQARFLSDMAKTFESITIV